MTDGRPSRDVGPDVTWWDWLMGLGLWNSVAGSDARTCGIGPPGTGTSFVGVPGMSSKVQTRSPFAWGRLDCSQFTGPPDHWTAGSPDHWTTSPLDHRHWTTGPSDRRTTGRRTRRTINQNLWYGVGLGFFETLLSDSWDNDQLT